MGIAAHLLGALALTVSLLDDPAIQPDKGSLIKLEPYPDSVQYCSETVHGAPGSPSIVWTGHYAREAPETVVAHYLKVLGSKNHETGKGQDVWRFPVDKPVQVLSVTTRDGPAPVGQNCRSIPATARALVIISFSTRQD